MCSICNKYCFKAALPYTSYLLLILAACVPITLHTIQADVHTTHRPASHASASISQAVNTPLEPAPPYIEELKQKVRCLATQGCLLDKVSALLVAEELKYWCLINMVANLLHIVVA
jgi:hypothetical protein